MLWYILETLQFGVERMKLDKKDMKSLYIYLVVSFIMLVSCFSFMQSQDAIRDIIPYSLFVLMQFIYIIGMSLAILLGGFFFYLIWCVPDKEKEI